MGDLRHAQLALEITEHGLHAMAHDRKKLLPLVAKLWDNYRHLFVHEHKGILLGAARIFQVLCSYCATFLRRRFQTEAWPDLHPLLRRMWTEVKAEAGERSSDAEQSHHARILEAILDSLTELSKYPSMVR